MKHYTVLKRESINGLNLHDNSVIVDGTLGYAGDSGAILKKINKGFLYAFDRDIEAISYSREVLEKIGSNYEIVHSSFSKIPEILKEKGITHVDGFLFDLGVSSPQLDENRGFSFMRDERLDMRMDKDALLSAYNVVNNYSYEELKSIFYRYGEEKKSPFIAKEIVRIRETKSIETTMELCEIIKSAVGANYYYKNHPERQIFQAIRIEVNAELKEIETVLPECIKMLNKGGRIVVVTFHSLEDRIVKQIFKKYSETLEILKGLPEIPDEYKPLIKLINKKPILPSEEELRENSRSASAKLRIVERI